MGNTCKKSTHNTKQVCVTEQHINNSKNVLDKIKIMSTNVLSQRAYEKYIDKTIIPIDEQTRINKFYELLYDTVPDIVAIQEGTFSWFTHEKVINKDIEYCYVGDNDKKSENCCFLYNRKTIKLIGSFTHFSWNFNDRNAKNLISQTFLHIPSNTKYYIINCHAPQCIDMNFNAENSAEQTKNIDNHLLSITNTLINISEMRSIPNEKLVICGDFNIFSKYDVKLANYMNKLLLKNIIHFSTCALSTKYYDMIDRFYIPSSYQNNYECEYYPKLYSDLLKHTLFDDKTTGDFYSDHSAIICTLVPSHIQV